MKKIIFYAIDLYRHIEMRRVRIEMVIAFALSGGVQ